MFEDKVGKLLWFKMVWWFFLGGGGYCMSSGVLSIKSWLQVFEIF